MAKIKQMGEGIVVKDAPEHRTTIDGVMAKGKRAAASGKTLLLRSLCGVESKVKYDKKRPLPSDWCELVLASAGSPRADSASFVKASLCSHGRSACCLFQRATLT